MNKNEIESGFQILARFLLLQEMKNIQNDDSLQAKHFVSKFSNYFDVEIVYRQMHIMPR